MKALITSVFVFLGMISSSPAELVSKGLSIDVDKNGTVVIWFLGELTMESSGSIVGRRKEDQITIGNFGAIGYEIRRRRKAQGIWLSASHIDIHFDSKPERLLIHKAQKRSVRFPLFACSKKDLRKMSKWIVDVEYRAGARVRTVAGENITVFANTIIDGKELAIFLDKTLKKEREKQDAGKKGKESPC